MRRRGKKKKQNTTEEGDKEKKKKEEQEEEYDLLVCRMITPTHIAALRGRQPQYTAISFTPKCQP